MLSMYPACFYKENDGYSVIFPDLNYLATQGDSFEDAMEMAVECLAAYLHSCRVDGETIPVPSSLSDIDPVAISKEVINELTVTNVVEPVAGNSAKYDATLGDNCNLGACLWKEKDPDSEWKTSIAHAVKIGLGTNEYNLIEI